MAHPSITNVSPELLKVCKEYFEISIGYRRPSDLEKREASERWLGWVFSEKEYGYIDFVKMLKYPIEFDTKSSLWYNGVFRQSSNPKLSIIRMEFGIYELLANRTGIVEAPYIPMLRHEARVSKNLLQQGEVHYAVLRQHTVFETFFRMKAGLGQVKWRWAVESAYRGEELIDEITYGHLDDFNQTRNNLAHNWFSHLQDDDSVREVARTGLTVISRLLMDELYNTFSSYAEKHPSQRLYTKLEHRNTSSISGNANASVKIKCDECGEQFDPQNHHKRCPKCQSWHGHWEE